MPKEIIQTTVRLDPNLHEKLKKRAEQTSRKINDFIIWLIKKDIEQNEKVKL